MIDYLMIFVGGLLGSSHCIGMCGGFVVALGSTSSRWSSNLGRQLVYSLGRVFTYAVGGAGVGYGGQRLTAELGAVIQSQAVLSIAAGVLLIIQGLGAAGVMRGVRWQVGGRNCLGAKFFADWLAATRLQSVFLGGMVNGLLPCGLVYAYLALAASSGNMLRGLATMTLFGLGTLPVMVLMGYGGFFLRGTWRHRLFRLAAWCVVLTGIVSLLRGFGVFATFGAPPEPGCPMCS